MTRKVEPEWLDALSPADPAAQVNRQDLLHLNRVLGTTRWFNHAVQSRGFARSRYLEIGAGSGDLGIGLGQDGVHVDGLDLWPAPQDWPSVRRWHQADVTRFEGWSDYDGVLANLFLHQLEDADLRKLGERIIRSKVRLVVAQEPWRSRWGQGLFLLAALVFGMGEVSRHDGWVSVRAGFCGDELPDLLGMASDGWRWRIEAPILGVYRMVAWREL